MVGSTISRGQPITVAQDLAIARGDFVIPRQSQDYRHRSVYLKTMSKNQIVMSWLYSYATGQDSKAPVGSRSNLSSVEYFVSLRVGPEPMVRLIDPYLDCSALKHSNLEHSGFASWS